ncbi:unnamed protein product [Rotaria sp. Silwood1]|nr:unnamed protein product [Rotaria sp. Silwood1]
MSNDVWSTSHKTTENENNMYDEQLRTTQVTVNLADCMQCRVEIPQCELTEQVQNSNLLPEKDFVYQAEELHQEQHIDSATPINQTQEVHEKEDNYSYWLDAELFDPMQGFIIIDLPWPKSSATDDEK